MKYFQLKKKFRNSQLGLGMDATFYSFERKQSLAGSITAFGHLLVLQNFLSTKGLIHFYLANNDGSF